jgi:hypothetical protein
MVIIESGVIDEPNRAFFIVSLLVKEENRKRGDIFSLD